MPRVKTQPASPLAIGRARWLTHGVLAALTGLSVALTKLLYVPRADLFYLITIGFGYLSITLIVVTLSIGTLNLIVLRFSPIPKRRPRNSSNLYLRRDVGIWAGITGIGHVVAALIIDSRGSLLDTFFRSGTVIPRTDLRGLLNHVGLIAVIVIVVLLITSNDAMLRRLKGKKWKALQRWNYGLAALVFFHTFGYQIASGRERPFIAIAVVLILILLIAQFIGVLIYTRREASV